MQSRLTRRDFLRKSALAAGGGIILACAPTTTGGPVPSASAQAKKGGNLVEGYVGDVRASMLPLFGGPEVAGFVINNLMYDGLLNSTANGDLQPVLATGMPTISSDQLTMTFKLKSGVKWTDGRDLTADDVVFTYRVFSAPEYKEANTTRRADFEQYMDSVTATDPATIVFKFKKPWAPFITFHGQYGIVPKHILGTMTAKELNTAEFNIKPTVSNGMFKFVKWDKGQQVVLERNPSYHRTPTLLDTYTMKILASNTAIASALQTGEIDMGIIDPTVVDQLKTVSHLQITDYGISAIIYLFYQLDPAKPASKFFSDRRVRQALLYGLDREKMAQALFFGAAAPGQSVIPSVTWAYDPNVTPKYTFDKAKAEQLLDDAGWKKGPSGVREKSGVPLKFELMGATGSKPLENAVVSIQEQWKAIGVEVAPKMVDSNTISNVSTNTREYDAMVSQRNMPQDPDPSLTWSSGNAAPGGFNTTGYKNPDVDKLIENAAAVFDQEQRKKIYSQFQNVMATEVPGPPLFIPREIVGVNKRVQGVVGSLGTFNRLRRVLWFKDVWVTDGK